MAKKYKKSHPWISFQLDLRDFPRELLFDLGECVSKSDHLQRTAMSAELQRSIYRLYLSKGAAATTAIEGNTLGEEAVQKIVEGKPLPQQESYEKLEVEVRNVLALFEDLFDKAEAASLPPLKSAQLHQFQARILHGLSIEGNVGSIRQRGVVVGGYRGAPREDCADLLEDLCRWLAEGDVFKALHDTLGKKAAGIIRACLVHLYLAWIHPYDDGNGRTARMAEFYSLVAAGFSAAAAHLPSNHCNRVREEYYHQLRTATEERTPIKFIAFMVRGLRDGLREQLQYVYEEHDRLIWQKHVEQRITGSAAARQRRLRLAQIIYEAGGAALSNPEIAGLYTGKKTRAATLLNLDLAELAKVAVVEKTPDGYKPHTAPLRALKPPVAK